MSCLALGADAVRRMTELATVLIPGDASMPAVASLEMFDSLLQVAVKACGYSNDEIDRAVAGIPPVVCFDSVRCFAEQHARHFEIVSTLVSGAYLMAPAVLDSLRFPTERQFPAGMEDFVEEYDSGVLAPVLERGPRFKDTSRR